jgi:hypothetical protein
VKARSLIPHPERFDFARFIASVLDLSAYEMADAITSEAQSVEAAMRGRGGAQARADGGAAYITRLLALGFWLHHGYVRPHQPELAACRQLAKALIARGEMKPEGLP